jgi:hypothetical protein
MRWSIDEPDEGAGLRSMTSGPVRASDRARAAMPREEQSKGDPPLRLVVGLVASSAAITAPGWLPCIRDTPGLLRLPSVAGKPGLSLEHTRDALSARKQAFARD